MRARITYEKRTCDILAAHTRGKTHTRACANIIENYRTETDGAVWTPADHWNTRTSGSNWYTAPRPYGCAESTRPSSPSRHCHENRRRATARPYRIALVYDTRTLLPVHAHTSHRDRRRVNGFFFFHFPPHVRTLFVLNVFPVIDHHENNYTRIVR
jgi:hypothetical protein